MKRRTTVFRFPDASASMKYQVIARKFRPQVFEQVVGQNPIVQTLKNAIAMDRIGHAYLFCGPRGVGKTTTARLLAKALNCAKGPTATPCNECPSCIEITSGGSIDVLEIDAASNTGVDSIRELRENARYAPSRDRFKVFIVDEVHMLSTSAFNALLKILEEPPSHIAFIMATTERHKLPATILSRCQQFVFRTIPPAEIQSHLKSIAEREGIGISEGALNYVVKASEGSMRDAQSLLDQIIAFGGQDISDGDVRDVLGFIPSDILDRSVDALIAEDPKALIEVVEVIVDQGLNLQQFVREFLARTRDLLLARLGITDKILAAPEDVERIRTQATQFSEQDLIRLFDMLLKLDSNLRWTAEPRFHLEVGCVKLCRLGKVRDIEEVIQNLKSGAPPTPPTTAPPPRPAPTPPARPPLPAGQRPTTGAPVRDVLKAGEEQPPARQAASRVAEQTRASAEPPARTATEAQAVSPPDSGSAAVRSPRTAPTAEAAPDQSGAMDAARDEPLVQSFLDVFRGEISHVRDADKKSDKDAPSES